jgi:hypothetical protein
MKTLLLARQLDYLKTENRILRSKLPGRIPLSRAERRRLIQSAHRSIRSAGPTVVECITVAFFLGQLFLPRTVPELHVKRCSLSRLVLQ